MKALAIGAGRSSAKTILPKFTAVSPAVVQKISTVTATACVVAAWIFALTNRDIACCIAALIGVTAAIAASSSTQARKGGEL